MSRRTLKAAPSFRSHLHSRDLVAQQIDPSSPAYNIGEYIELNGRIDALLFERALRRVVVESEALRVQIIDLAGQAGQIVGPPPAWSMPLIDVSAETDPRAAAESWMRTDLARPVELTSGPLFGFALFKASADRFFWYARYHHIVMDGLSMWLVARRLADIYTQLSTERATQDDSFGSLSVLLEQDAAYRASEQLARDRRYWNDYLADRPQLATLAARPQPQSQSFLRGTAYLHHPEVDALRSIAHRTRTSLPQVIAAATAIFLHRLSGATDVVFGLPVAGRNTDSRCIPGMASNVLRVNQCLLD